MMVCARASMASALKISPIELNRTSVFFISCRYELTIELLGETEGVSNAAILVPMRSRIKATLQISWQVASLLFSYAPFR